jgi:hypothetical protein
MILDVSLKRLHGIEDADILIGQLGSLINRKGIDLLFGSLSILSLIYNKLQMILVAMAPN